VKRSFLLFFIPFVVITWISLVLFQKGCDFVESPNVKKEVPFNHKTHLTKYGATCDTCHTYNQDGSFNGIPTVGQCTGCHARNAVLNPKDLSIPKRKPFFDKYKDSDKPWNSYAKQPDLVYFTHKVVMTAKFPDGRLKSRCGSCHGDKANSTTTKMIKGKMLMGQCMDCHTALNISNSCTVCHD